MLFLRGITSLPLFENKVRIKLLSAEQIAFLKISVTGTRRNNRHPNTVLSACFEIANIMFPRDIRMLARRSKHIRTCKRHLFGAQRYTLRFTFYRGLAIPRV